MPRLVNQPLAALANLETNLSRSQFGHTQSELDANGAQPAIQAQVRADLRLRYETSCLVAFSAENRCPSAVRSRTSFSGKCSNCDGNTQ